MALLERDNFFVITGCSGGGKSSIIDALRARGFHCIDEAGRQIVKEQVASGGDATPWQDQVKFGELLLARYIELFEQVAERKRPVFFDRAIPEILTFSRVLKYAMPEHHRVAAAKYRYARKVFVTPPWPEIFATDSERRHSFEDGLTEYPFTLDAYRDCGYELIEIPKAPVSQRIEFILHQIGVR